MKDIKTIPVESEVREAIRALAALLIADLPSDRPPRWEALESTGGALLSRLDLPREFLGFAMVCLNNTFWSGQFAAVPPARRLFLLPHCMNDQDHCAGHYDSVGLHCAGCGACALPDFKSQAEQLGYQVLIAEGTPAVLLKVLEGGADAILGVACLDSLEKSYARIADLGIPHLAVPLLHNGCVRTEADTRQILAYLELTGLELGSPCAHPTRSYLPLLREAVGIFEGETLVGLLAPYLARPLPGTPDSLLATEREALACLAEGGKRLRPFITMAAYALAAHGAKAIAPGFVPAALIPLPVRRLAIAIEAMHKASLIHDDIEDEDDYRDGRQTLHKRHGLAPAINIGDFLIGLGYRLVAGEVEALGAPCVVEILNHLAAAHLELCRGQGGELLWSSPTLRPIDALHLYSLKTAPAFEVALHAGLQAAGVSLDPQVLKRYCAYLGEGFQVQDDLDDWRADGTGRLALRREAFATRPTILRAFALEAGARESLADLKQAPCRGGDDLAAAARRMGEVYASCGAFAKAEALLDRLRGRALEIAEAMESPDLKELLGFLVRIILPRGSASPPESGTGAGVESGRHPHVS